MAKRTADSERIAMKQQAVVAKIKEIAPHAEMLLQVLDEDRLDHLIIGLGLGTVNLATNDE